ncbi:MAG: 2-hydroxychromene-2-carboxylate isomerase [Burkholderiaceae bacterium]|nr:2-hydroxychromene-2-carboxylate isomerase [Burkholderiaceae bacterium]
MHTPADSGPTDSTGIEWFFDPISPFAYLQSTRLRSLASRARLTCTPVLFAGLLEHHGNKGPAEVAPKRQWTFEHVAWLAWREAIPLKLPAAHPFVPLPLLRAAIAGGCTLDVVERIFRFVWVDGHLPQDANAYARLLNSLQIDAADVERTEVKAALRQNTERAIESGVFGVPTLRIDGHNFWGQDATDMALAWLERSPFFESDLLRQARALPQGVSRRMPGLPRPAGLDAPYPEIQNKE